MLFISREVINSFVIINRSVSRNQVLQKLVGIFSKKAVTAVLRFLPPIVSRNIIIHEKFLL